MQEPIVRRILKGSTAFAAALLSVSAANAATVFKNIMAMIADGACYNMVDAARLYGGPLAVDNPLLRSAGISTFPLRTGTTPIPGGAGLAQNPGSVYNSASNWNTNPVAG